MRSVSGQGVSSDRFRTYRTIVASAISSSVTHRLSRAIASTNSIRLGIARVNIPELVNYNNTQQGRVCRWRMEVDPRQ
jgi:hypothetical protein